MTYIYKLIDPRNNKIRYVGKTINIKRRYKQHLYEKDKSHKSLWVQSLRNQKLKPIIEILENCNYDNWKEREIYWIKQFDNLTNLQEGGGSDYVKTTPDETKLKLSLAHLGVLKDDEWKKNIGLGAKYRKEVTINGIVYSSIRETMRKLKIGFKKAQAFTKI